jgi:hypothetical protein
LQYIFTTTSRDLLLIILTKARIANKNCPPGSVTTRAACWEPPDATQYPRSRMAAPITVEKKLLIFSSLYQVVPQLQMM